MDRLFLSLSDDPAAVRIGREAPFDPAQFIERGWSILKHDHRSALLPAFQPRRVVMLPYHATSRLVDFLLDQPREGYVPLDLDAFLVLWRRQELIPGCWAMRRMGMLQRIVFAGTVLRSPAHQPCLLQLCREPQGWAWTVRSMHNLGGSVYVPWHPW